LTHVLGIIPARGGSKGIPRKNLVPLGGRPLIAYSCDAARASRRLTRTIVSTDDAEIAAAAAACGIATPFLRPPHLAADDTPMLDVLRDVLATLDRSEQYRPDIVVLLQPTSPFRRADDIDVAVDLLDRTGADSVVTVTEVPHQFTPASLLRLEGDRVQPWTGTTGPLRRQDKPRVFARNGPAVLAARPHVLEQGSLYGSDVRAVVMGREESIDIDDAFDLRVADLLLTARGVKHGA
jgi:CMP-N,N'-diacetyllegionaminic acid synthase